MCEKLVRTAFIMPGSLYFISRLRHTSHYKNRAKVDSTFKREIEFWKQVIKKTTKGVATHTLEKGKHTIIMSINSSFEGIGGLLSSGVFWKLQFDTEGCFINELELLAIVVSLLIVDSSLVTECSHVHLLRDNTSSLEWCHSNKKSKYWGRLLT